MKRVIAFSIALTAACSGFAKTFDWPLSAPVAEAKLWTAYHGETVRFNLVFSGAMSNVTAEAIYYQTNGMGKTDWFGPVPGTVFHPTNDCGAASYRFFVKCSDPDGRNYTPNGTLRLLDSPGFEPSTVQLPVAVLDFATVEVANAPWPAEIDSATNSLSASLSSQLSRASQAATNYTDRATTGLLRTETDPTVPSWAKATSKPSYSWSEITSKPSLATVATSGSYNDLSNKPTIPTVPTAQINAATTTNALQDAAIAGKADTNDVVLTEVSGFSEWVFPGFPEIDEYSEKNLVPYENWQGIVLEYWVRDKDWETGEWGDWYILSSSDNYAPLDATSFTWLVPMGGEEPNEYTGTRTAQSGYQLGTQSNKVVAAQTSLTALGNTLATNYYTKAETDAAIPTSAADLGAVPVTRTVNGKALSADVSLSASDVGAVAANSAITGATKCKITYDSKGLVTVGADLAASDIPSLTVSKLSDFQSAIRYSFNSATVGSGTTPTISNVLDRCINAATLSNNVTAATINLPAATTGYARDFFINLTIEASAAPTLTFLDPATSTTANVQFGSESLADIAPGYNLILFTEIAANKFLVSVKHEDAQ